MMTSSCFFCDCAPPSSSSSYPFSGVVDAGQDSARTHDVIIIDFSVGSADADEGGRHRGPELIPFGHLRMLFTYWLARGTKHANVNMMVMRVASHVHVPDARLFLPELRASMVVR